MTLAPAAASTRTTPALATHRRRTPKQPPPQPRRRVPPEPRHYLSLAGAETVWLPVFEDLARALEQTTAQQTIMCLSGDAGVGKTFALNTVLASTALPGHRTRLGRLVPRPAPTPAALRSHLADALGLTDVSQKDPHAFNAALRDQLAARDHLLVVDEAQRLNAASFEYLRYLFDAPDTRLALVLAVGERGGTVLRRQKMLATRTAVSLKVPPLTPDEVRWAIPRFHPLWQTSTPDAVERLDTRLCHGNFRRWAAVTQHALRLLRPTRPQHGLARLPVLEDLLDVCLLPHQDTP